MIEIRECRRADFEQILTLLHQLWPKKSLDRERLRKAYDRRLRSPDQFHICATIDADVIGFCSLTVKSSLSQQGYLGFVDELVVDKQHRGRGVGTLLLHRITTIAAKNGCREIELDSYLHRKGAHSFYEKHGFTKRVHLYAKEI
ncbi:MAG: GNAT family N-acetyltransferase [Deltaproteobacteria bacterium]|nr:GNAT family N-acetyltransferase [Deltaproteobacteria bacterium]